MKRNIDDVISVADFKKDLAEIRSLLKQQIKENATLKDEIASLRKAIGKPREQGKLK